LTSNNFSKSIIFPSPKQIGRISVLINSSPRPNRSTVFRTFRHSTCHTPLSR